MKESALKMQIGGNHYVTMPYQPAQFLCKLHVAFNPGAIVKYVSRNKTDEIEDLNKAIHFCEICADLDEGGLAMWLRRWVFSKRVDRETWKYVRKNNFRYPQVRFSVIHDVLRGNWDSAAENIRLLLYLYRGDENVKN